MKRILRLGSLESPSRSLRSKLKGERWTKEEGFPLLYHGYSTMKELRSQEEAMAALQTVKQTSREQQVVQVKCRGTELSVVDAKDEQLLSCSLLSVAQCVQETTHGFSDCISVVFSSGAWAGQCHVFQAKSSREAADIAHSLQKHVKFAHRLTGRKRADSGSTTGVSYTPTQLHRGFSEPMGHQTTPPSPSDRLGVRNRDGDTGSPIPTTTRDRSPSSSRGGSSQQAPVSPRSRRLFRKQKELTRLERAEHVCKASIAVEDSCAHLLAACRKPHPQSPFEKVLSAIGSSDMAALKDLLELKLLGIDSCDHDGNTLLHYAVSAGSVGAVKMLAERMAAINGPNVAKTRPLHRAAAVGRPTMVRLLLDMGASVNALDGMSCTPLHLAAARGGTHLESVLVLLEHGASINTADGIGMRPHDLLPSVKEMQTRLIASVCKNFADPPERNTSPTSASPYLSSSPSLRGPYDGRDIGDLVQVVQGQARSLRSWALSRRNKNKAKKTISRSFSNLSELLEVDEDEMYRQDRLKKLQFPTSDYTPEYLELVGGAEEVQSKLNSLIRRGRSASKGIKRSSSDPELTSLTTSQEESRVNKPQIVVGGDIQAAMADTFSALLQRFSTDQDHPAERRRRRSGRVSIGSNLSEAFDSLQQDLQTEGSGEARVEKEEVVKISPQTTHKFKHHHQQQQQQQPVSDGQVHSHSKEETVAILDNIVADIMSAAEDCNTEQTRLERPASGRTRRKSAVTRREIIKDSSSSSESKRRLSLSDARQFLSSADSAASSTSSSLSSLHDPQYRSHRSSSLAIARLPYDPDSREAGLDQLVILSTNKECLSTLVSHMGLPKFAERLLSLARSPQSSDSLLHSIATLIQNIFEGGGPEGRKLAVEAGLLDTIVKLLSTRDPIPGTCLVLLNSLLVSDDDNDYLRTIVRIPADPLLSFLEPSESDIDSGFDRDMSVSVTTHSSSDDPRTMDPSFLVPPAAWFKDRASSLMSSDSSSSRSVASPTIQVGHYISASEARRIVLKMLAVSSTHHKMKESLRAQRTLSLLTDYLTATSHENITNTIIALANIAQNTACHHYLLQIGIPDRLRPLLGKGPRPRYHALRLLVYIGKLKLNGLSLYDSTGYEMDSITHTTADHHQYVRGATIEKSVDLLTGDDSRSLWGGIALPDTSHHPSRDKIAEFFLSTYHSFMHPVLLMRLLLHRLDDSSSSNPFGWMRDLDSLSPSHLHTIPQHHQAVLNLLQMWVELLPEDFRNHTRLQDYVKELVDRMKKYRGVYTSHAHRLRSLMHDLQHSPTHSRSESTSPQRGAAGKKRKPHHENLYTQCKQLVCEGHLPVTAEQAVLLAALQLHIEALADSELKQAYNEGLRTKKYPRLFLTHLKKALPVMYSKTKKIAKRTSEKMAEFDGTCMSDRNAKHLYIQRCQGTPGYNCTFYSVKVPSVSKFRRSSQTHILGISDNHLVLLDDKTRELTSTHSLQEVRRVSHTQTDPCSLSIVLNHTVIKLHADKESAARQIVLSLDNCGQKVLQSYDQADLDEWVTSWGQSAPSLHTPDDSSSSHDDSRDLPANGSLTSPPPPEIPQETWPAATTEMEATFCNCPPDPDFPLNIDIRVLALSEILEHPMELARQLTLLDHSKFGSITRRELLMRVSLVPRLSSEQQSNEGEPGVERLAYQFNQVANWVARCVLQYHSPEDRAWSVVQFIEMAQYCLQYRNYSSMMAIVVAGLLSPYIRRLKKTWMHVGKVHTSQFKHMETLLSSRNNYKNYRDMLDQATLPAVPFVAIFTRDLRFICDGNPDYLRNGLVNLHKRRQIFSKLEEVRHYQCERYNFEPVPGLQDMIESYSLVSEDELHALSRSLEQKSVVGGRLGGRPRSNSISSLTNIVTLKPPLGKAMRGSSTNNLFL